MILSGKEIINQQGKGLEITPFSLSQVNPNSYNLRLFNELLVYDEPVLDMKKPNSYRKITIPEEGLILEPGKLYLGRTVEHTRTTEYVPMLEGRSSVGRLGVCIHITAGFGDVGFNGYWTLELFCIQPVKIYPFVDICQIYYHTIEGEYDFYTSSKYNNNENIQPSLMYKDFGVQSVDFKKYANHIFSKYDIIKYNEEGIYYKGFDGETIFCKLDFENDKRYYFLNNPNGTEFAISFNSDNHRLGIRTKYLLED